MRKPGYCSNLIRRMEGRTQMSSIKLMAVAAAVAVMAVGAGCGDSGGVTGKEGPLVPAGPAKGNLTISQWPYYVDPGKNGTVAEFERTKNINVKWIEDINDNLQFFGKLRPQLAQGSSGGRSLITLSDWLAARMYDLGYLQRLNYDQLPNVKNNMLDTLRHPKADPDRKFTVPWQSGMTGLIVRT